MRLIQLVAILLFASVAGVAVAQTTRTPAGTPSPSVQAPGPIVRAPVEVNRHLPVITTAPSAAPDPRLQQDDHRMRTLSPEERRCADERILRAQQQEARARQQQRMTAANTELAMGVLSAVPQLAANPSAPSTAPQTAPATSAPAPAPAAAQNAPASAPCPAN